MSSKFYTQICIEILQINKYNEYMILVHDTIYYGDNIKYKYHMQDTRYYNMILYPFRNIRCFSFMKQMYLDIF
jgi:hypothetical protein